jgi:transposase-like protein
MTGVETIARIRFEHFQNGKGIRRIARELGIARDTVRKGLCHVNLNWPREVSTTQFEFMRLSQLATSGKLLLGRRGACGVR